MSKPIKHDVALHALDEDGQKQRRQHEPGEER